VSIKYYIVSLIKCYIITTTSLCGQYPSEEYRW